MINHFNFMWRNGEVLVTNDFGDYAFLKKEEFSSLATDRVHKGSALYELLSARGFVSDDDPSVFISKRIDDLRSIKRLAGVAERTRCAIVLIGHMTKATSGKNLYRGLLMIERDPEDSSIRYMFPIKSSLAYEGCAIRFMFDRLIGFQFLGTSNYKSISEPDQDEGSKAQRAERMIRAMLSDGEQAGKTIIEHIQEAGISEHTIRLIARRIGVKPFRKGTKWYWKLEQIAPPQEVHYV